MTRRGFWKGFPMFEGLGPAALDALAASARPQTWAAGEMLFQRDDPGDWMVAIESGRVRIALSTGGGRELVLRHAEAGEMLGELALFDGQPRSASATAAGPVTGQVLTRRAFEALMDRHPEAARAALAHLACLVVETSVLL